MLKSYYKPKSNKPKKNSIQEIENPIVEIKEIMPIENTLIEIVVEVQLSPMDSTYFCNQKNITSISKGFLEKKYATKKYTMEKWGEILIKENMLY